MFQLFIRHMTNQPLGDRPKTAVPILSSHILTAFNGTTNIIFNFTSSNSFGILFGNQHWVYKTSHKRRGH